MFLNFNYLGIFIFIILLYLIYNYYKKNINEYFFSRNNNYQIDITEFKNNINYNMIKPEEFTYIFWSGGYSSTFRLIQLLLLEEKSVQTIYINLDNEEKNRLEIEHMKEIRELLCKNYPIVKNRFPPTMYVSKIKRNPELKKQFDNLHTKYGFFEFDSSKDKFELMARYSYYHDYPIEICIDKDEYHLNNAIKKFLEKKSKFTSKKLDTLPIHYIDLNIFKNCRFPLVDFTKEEMKNTTIRNNFYYIIKKSWTCTNSKNNLACNECPNCLKRIV